MWEQVGTCDVDSGLIWFGDPCYIISEEPPYKTWMDFVNNLDEKEMVTQFNHNKGHVGRGVALSSGYGDGAYDVFVKRVNGRIAEAKIVFIEE